MFSVEEILPAVGAGTLALECRATDTKTTELLVRLNHERTQAEATAERVMLQGLREHCNSPIAGYCVTDPDGQLSLRGMVFSHDSSTFVHAHIRGERLNDPAVTGSRVCSELLRQGARDIIEGIPPSRHCPCSPIR